MTFLVNTLHMQTSSGSSHYYGQYPEVNAIEELGAITDPCCKGLEVAAEGHLDHRTEKSCGVGHDNKKQYDNAC